MIIYKIAKLLWYVLASFYVVAVLWWVIVFAFAVF